MSIERRKIVLARGVVCGAKGNVFSVDSSITPELAGVRFFICFQHLLFWYTIWGGYQKLIYS